MKNIARLVIAGFIALAFAIGFMPASAEANTICRQVGSHVYCIDRTNPDPGSKRVLPSRYKTYNIGGHIYRIDSQNPDPGSKRVHPKYRTSKKYKRASVRKATPKRYHRSVRERR